MRAITVVAGNVPVEQGVQNALYTVELAGADVPVYAARRSRASASSTRARPFTVSDGMGDIGLELTGRAAADGDAARCSSTRSARRPGEVTLVTLGPLTNVAAALERGRRSHAARGARDHGRHVGSTAATSPPSPSTTSGPTPRRRRSSSSRARRSRWSAGTSRGSYAVFTPARRRRAARARAARRVQRRHPAHARSSSAGRRRCSTASTCPIRSRWRSRSTRRSRRDVERLHVAVETTRRADARRDGRRLSRHERAGERRRRARGVTRAVPGAPARCAPRLAAPPLRAGVMPAEPHRRRCARSVSPMPARLCSSSASSQPRSSRPTSWMTPPALTT